MAKKNNILVTGSHGLVGSSFISNIFNHDTHVMGEFIESRAVTLICPDHSKMDISKKSEVARYVEKYRPEVIINFAAHRNANTAEEQREDKKGSAWKSNVVGVDNISSFCGHYGIYLIHISTDMVFSGYEDNKGPYDEESVTEEDISRLSWYGWTKKLGEEFVRSKKNSAIIRIANITRPVYDPTLDYVGKLLWLYDSDKLYPMFNDQFATLTYIPHITEAILILIEKKLNGIFHIGSTNLFTPDQLTNYLFSRMKLKKISIKGVSIDEYLKDKPNRYPKHGGLKSIKTQKRLGLKFSTWEEIVDDFVLYVNNLKL